MSRVRRVSATPNPHLLAGVLSPCLSPSAVGARVLPCPCHHRGPTAGSDLCPWAGLAAGAHGITWSCTSTATARGRRSRAGSSHSSEVRTDGREGLGCCWDSGSRRETEALGPPRGTSTFATAPAGIGRAPSQCQVALSPCPTPQVLGPAVPLSRSHRPRSHRSVFQVTLYHMFQVSNS